MHIFTRSAVNIKPAICNSLTHCDGVGCSVGWKVRHRGWGWVVKESGGSEALVLTSWLIGAFDFV